MSLSMRRLLWLSVLIAILQRGQTTSHRLHGSSVIVFSQPEDDQKLLSSVIRGQPTPSYVSSSEIVILKSQV